MLLALIGGAAVGTAFSWNRRNERRVDEKRQYKQDVRDWEAEGGSLATPATAHHRS
jgi:hypothetical protein